MNPSCYFFLLTQALKHSDTSYPSRSYILVPRPFIHWSLITGHRSLFQDHLSRSEFVTTDTELSAMAMAA
jgi:hypothetical protein